MHGESGAPTFPRAKGKFLAGEDGVFGWIDAAAAGYGAGWLGFLDCAVDYDLDRIEEGHCRAEFGADGFDLVAAASCLRKFSNSLRPLFVVGDELLREGKCRLWMSFRSDFLHGLLDGRRDDAGAG